MVLPFFVCKVTSWLKQRQVGTLNEFVSRRQFDAHMSLTGGLSDITSSLQSPPVVVSPKQDFGLRANFHVKGV